MIIGVPKEIKNTENRVGLTPAGVETLVHDGHTVYIENHAGEASGFTNQDYTDAGAKILDTAKEIYSIADMIIKVKEPIEPEFDLLKPGQILFTYLHLAADKKLTELLRDKKVTTVAYETVQKEDRSLPLLVPMSEVAGRMSVQIGARFLEKQNGGKGILLGGTPGTIPAKVVVVGAGTAGLNAAKTACGFGADVIIMNSSLKKLADIDHTYHSKIKTLASNTMNLKYAIKDADLVISTVLVPGAKAPKIITEEMVKSMSPGSVIVDISIDQGGSVATIDRATTHENPVFVKHGVVHYSVANIPGAVPRTSTMALTNATLPYARIIADKGIIDAVKECSDIALGVNTINGKLTSKPVAEAHELDYTPLETAINA